MLVKEFTQKYSNLIAEFERTTGKKAILKNGKITKGFKYWLSQKIKYKDGFICDDPDCPDYGKEFFSKRSLVHHINWHNKEYRERMSGENASSYGKHRTDETKKKIGDANRGKVRTEEHKRIWSKSSIKKWNKPGYRENHSGKNSHMYGRYGEESNSFKENAGIEANHLWINLHYPQKDICNDKCEICGKINLNLDLARFIHIDVRNMEDPMIDYFYTCPRKEKNSCHRIYDKLTEEQKEELLAGTITREEKLKRVKEYVII